jgi:seryl-tRNA synthetase
MKKSLLLFLLLFSTMTLTLADSTLEKEGYLKKEEELKVKLVHILESLKKFKQEKNSKIETLNHKLNLLKKEFSLYKKVKEKKIKKMSQELKSIRKKLVQKEHSSREKQTSQNIKMLQPSFIPKINNLPWVEIVVEDGLNIYQLALKYYGDEKQYKYIYAANQQTIPNNYKITDGMSLKIPMPDSF